MSSDLSVVAVTCLALEARIAAGAGVSVICSHAAHLIVALEAAIRQGAGGIISFGIAGGLAPDLLPGDWVIAAGVRSDRGRLATDHGWARRLLAALPGAVHADIVGVDAPVADPMEKRRMRARTGAAAVDMESHIAARIAAAHGLPFAACRVVIDPAHRQLPPAALVGLRLDGTPDVGAVLGSLARQPAQLPALTRMALDLRAAGKALRRGRRLLGAGLGFPYFGELALDVA
jgi:hopanoid-associated phosphorylase